MTENDFMQAAIGAATKGMNNNEGGPFGAAVVQNGKIIALGNNRVTTWNDPTAHAEVVAIREACKQLGDFQLTDCELYTSCEPCPMCLGAIYWARLSKVYFACNRTDAAKAGFDDDYIYQEINQDLASRAIPFKEILRNDAIKVFDQWIIKENKTKY